MIGIAIANSLGLNFLRGIFGPYKSRVEADGGITEAGGCVDAGATPLLQTASLLLIPSGYKANKLYSEIPTNGNGDLTWTRTSTAIRTNSSGLLESMGTGVPRLDYTYGSCPSALLEPQRTNSIRNSTMVGASTSPSTLPTNWVRQNTSGLTQSVVGIGTENGINYIDINLSGTATGSNDAYSFDQTISASLGQTWTNSWYFKLVSSTPNAVRLAIQEFAGGSFLNVLTQDITPTTSLTRYTQTKTLVGTGVTNVRAMIYVNFVVGQSYNTTIRIAQPQMELGAYATTPIFTSGATATRVADSAVKTGISSLIGQSEGVMYWEGRIIQGVPTDLLIIGTTQDSVFFNLTTTPSLRVGVRTNNTLVINATSSTLSGTYFKIAVAYKSGDIVAYVNGTQVFTNTQTFTFSGAISEIEIGRSFFDSKATQFNQSTALFPTRLTNSQLASLTTL